MKTPIPTRLYIGKARITRGGEHYEVRLGSTEGQILVRSTTEPLLAGCRALLHLGITGTVELWDGFRTSPRMQGDISALAKLTVAEGIKTSPTFRTWKPFSAATVSPKTANLPSGLGGPHPTDESSFSMAHGTGEPSTVSSPRSTQVSTTESGKSLVQESNAMLRAAKGRWRNIDRGYQGAHAKPKRRTKA